MNYDMQSITVMRKQLLAH